jgi:ferrous iron transport protein A
MAIPLTSLKQGEKAKIVRLNGGQHFLTKLRSIGVREKKVLTVIAIHPWGGPVVIDIDGRDTSIGRGMAERILVEVLD